MEIRKQKGKQVGRLTVTEQIDQKHQEDFTLRIPQPMVIGRTSDPKATTHLSDRISFCFSQFPDGLIFT
jgi:hypothetical protein